MNGDVWSEEAKTCVLDVRVTREEEVYGDGCE